MSTLPAVVTDLITDLEAAQKITPQTAGGDFQYLKMSKGGEWVYGADETEVDADSVFVIDPGSYAQGFVAWHDGELIDESMAGRGQTPIIMGDLPALPQGMKWSPQVAFALKGVEGREEGMQMLYKVSSRGGREAIADLLGEIVQRGKSGETAVCPVVALQTDSYKHKKYGKIYTPILAVDDWLDLPGPEDTKPETKKVEKKEPAKAKRARRSRKTA